MVFITRTRCNQLSECLSYDILDEKFIKLCHPYRVVQKILGSCRLDIKDRFVTPPTLLQKFYTTSIICITMTIIISTKNRALILDFLIMATMTALNICLLLLLSIRSEMFLREVDKTKKLSNTILSRYLDGPLRQKAKKMLKIIERDTPRFCVYNMWYMDARLLLNIFAIITNAFVIILQFSFT
ncbi:uncharacterized protein LOC134806688 [Cydia splendana]|uniref:uncharacterized protein LOC134806688 n=1 Tax=Cydia splendana TaxID=1100963 RepID=UPI00300CE356